MRELKFLINEVRESTDNVDTNGVKDKEIVRYFNEAIKSVQAIVFKNNPLCSYFQEPTTFAAPIAGRAFDLPTNTYADNAVSMVEVKSDSSSTDEEAYVPIDRCFAEDRNHVGGWFTRNKQVVFSGRQDSDTGKSARAWYFKRLPRIDKVWATVSGVAGQVVTLSVLDTDFDMVDNFLSFLTPDGSVRVAGLKFTKTGANQVTVVGSLTGVVNGDLMVMGKDTLLTVDLPEEVEPFVMSYVAKKIYTRNNYSTDASKIEGYTAEDRATIISIFGDIGQAIQSTPITDTSYMGI